jgi:hypothetical protein
LTTKTDYTEQEWQGLVEAPLLTGTYIIIADVSMTALAKEMRGMYDAMITADVPDASRELISALVDDIKATSDMDEKMEKASTSGGEDPKADLMKRLTTALAVLDEKSTPEEKTGYCEWLMAIANATAQAGREGGFLGIGSVRVSKKEKAALAELQQAFGLDT